MKEPFIKLTYYLLTRVNVRSNTATSIDEVKKYVMLSKHHEMAYCIEYAERVHVTAESRNADIGRCVSGGRSSTNDAPRSNYAFNSATVSSQH